MSPSSLARSASFLLVVSSLPWLVACSSDEKGSNEDAPQSTGGSAPATGGNANTCGATGGCVEPGTGGTGGSGTGGSGSGGTAAGAGSAPGSGGGNAANVCGTADEAASVTLTCPTGLVLGDVVFASYGSPTGACGAFETGSCDAPAASSIVHALCSGKNSCSVDASNANFGDPCNGSEKSLAVEVSCVESVPPGTEPYKGVANSPCSARKALNVSWYYNWEQNEKEPCSDGGGGTFVPMIWGHPGNEVTSGGITNSVTSFVGKGYSHVLGFNEPDNSTQSNIPVNTAMTLLPAFDNPSIQIVGPATAANANPGQAWFTDFMSQLNASSARVDVLAIHWYGWNAGSCDASATQLENYVKWAEGFAGGRPIWITEWGCLNQSAPDEQTVIAFFQGALAMFARHPRIERYAWYPWSTNLGLNDSDGSLTALGEVYAAAPAYR